MNLVRLLLDDQIDTLFFLEDLLQTNNDAEDVISNAILSFGLIPSIFETMLPNTALKPEVSILKSSLRHSISNYVFSSSFR